MSFRAPRHDVAMTIVVEYKWLATLRWILLCISVWTGQLWFASEAAFERVTRAIGQECTHPGSSQPRSGLCIVKSILIKRVTINTLTLSLTPTDTPSGMTRRCRQWNNMADVARRVAKGPFKDSHSAHGPTDGDCYGFHSKVVENKFVYAIEG